MRKLRHRVGTNGATAGDCAGGIALASAGPASTPTIYQSCIRGLGTGFWRSIDGGVDFVRFDVKPGGPRQDFYPPAVDPMTPGISSWRATR
jgi:hypothetical protein